MLAIELLSLSEIAERIAARCRAARLRENLTQQGLSERSGVALGTLKRFERTGHASLQTVLRLAIALDRLSTFEQVFEAPEFESLEEVLNEAPVRKRGRRT